MQKIKIKKVVKDNKITYVIPALELKNINNDVGLLVPHPQGNSTTAFDTIEEAINAAKRAGFEYILPDGTEDNATALDTKNIKDFKNDIKEILYNKFSSKVNDMHTNISAAALSALNELNDNRCIEIFMDKLGEDNDSIRTIAINALVKNRNSVISHLIDALSDENWVKRNSAITCLEKISAYPDINIESIIVPLLNRTDDNNAIVQANAITALGNIYKNIMSQADS